MEKIRVKILSRALSAEAQGVGSAYIEQTRLVKENLSDKYYFFEKLNGKADLLHVHTINPTFYLKMKFRNKMKTISIGYVHFLPETLEQSIKLWKPIKKIFYKYVIHFYKTLDYLVVVNPLFIEKLVALGLKRERITYIPNFVSNDEFYKLSKETKLELKEKYNIGKDKFTVLGVGQLQIRKGILDFIEIAKKMPDIEFVWAGGFSFGKITDGYKEIIAAKQEAPANVHFLGILPREKMNEIYNLADLFFLPSYAELFPMCILESMNISLPLLLREVDLYEPILFDYYLSANNNEEFAKLIRRLKDDQQFYTKYQEKSHEGHQYYSKENNIKMWDSLYSECFLKMVSNNKPKKQKKFEDKIKTIKNIKRH